MAKWNPIMFINSHLWGQSIDEMVGAPNTFNYSQNIDIHNKLWAVTLSRNPETVDCDDLQSVFASVPWKMYRFADWWRVYEQQDSSVWSQWTLKTTLTWIWTLYSACGFNGNIFVFWSSKIIEYNYSLNTFVDRTPAWRSLFIWYWIIPTLNFHETWILMWRGATLYWYDPVLTTWTTIRSFSQWQIVWIIEYFEQVWIVVNHNWYDSRVYILWWTFDVDDIGVLWRIPLPWISVQSVGQMGNQTFLLAQDDSDKRTTYFYELQGSTPVLLKKSRNDFYWLDKSYVTFKQWRPPLSDWKYMYIFCWDWIYRYWTPSPFIPPAFTQIATMFNGAGFPDFWQPRWYTIHGNYLIVTWWIWAKITRRYIWDEPELIKYCPSWSVEYRQFKWDSLVKKKQNIRMVVGYKLNWSTLYSPQIKVYIWVNWLGSVLIDTISTITIPNSWGQKRTTHVIESEKIPKDRNEIVVKIELIRWTDETFTPELYECYLEYTPILDHAL